ARGFLGDSGGRVTIIREQFHEKLQHPTSVTYAPNWPEHGELAARSGHGGGDFWMMYHFGQAIKTGRQPFLNVYRGVAMSIVGILAWRSALNDSNTVDIPDLRKKAIRKEYENDHWTPDPAKKGPGQPPTSIDGFVKYDPEAVKYAKKMWNKKD
ncbi:MAG: hypothetical protein GX811_01850, partial [Lentisphaerae bacterium]|nr:hypothetical protein [Lentisphaerota bacterium]